MSGLKSRMTWGQSISYYQANLVVHGVWVWTPATKPIPPTPAIEAEPATIFTDFNVGWNSRAESVAVVEGLGRFDFQVSPSSVGVVVGIGGQRGLPHFMLEHAFYFSRATVVVMEKGVKLGPTRGFTGEDVFSLARVPDGVMYLINDEEVWFTPSSTMRPSILQAALYVSGDMVFNASVSTVSGGRTSLPNLFGIGFEKEYGTSSTFLPQLICEGRDFDISVHASLSPLTSLGSDTPIGSAITALSPLTGTGYGSAEELGYALSATSLAYLQSYLTGRSVKIVRSNCTLLPITGLGSDREYAASISYIEELEGFALSYAEGDVHMTSLGEAFTEVFGSSLISVLMSSTGQVTGAISFDLLMDAELSSTGQASTTFDLDSAIEATILSVISARTSLGMGSAGDTCWVVNADTGASSRYEGFEFNSFATLDGQLYATREDGLYRVGADDDAGEPIRAMISLGRQTFGSTHLKGLTAAYLGVSSTDTMYLKVVVNGGNEYIYRARRNDEFMKTQRIDTGKGLRANYFDFEIYNSDGSDFELDSVEFAPVQLSRRI